MEEEGIAGFGERLFAARKKRKWTQRQAAQELGISQTYFWQLEKEQVQPPFSILTRIAALFGEPIKPWLLAAGQTAAIEHGISLVEETPPSIDRAVAQELVENAVRRATERVGEQITGMKRGVQTAAIRALKWRWREGFAEFAQSLTEGRGFSGGEDADTIEIAAILRGYIPTRDWLLAFAHSLDLPATLTNDLYQEAGYGGWDPYQEFVRMLDESMYFPSDRITHRLRVELPPVERRAQVISPREMAQWFDDVQSEIWERAATQAEHYQRGVWKITPPDCESDEVHVAFTDYTGASCTTDEEQRLIDEAAVSGSDRDIVAAAIRGATQAARMVLQDAGLTESPLNYFWRRYGQLAADLGRQGIPAPSPPLPADVQDMTREYADHLIEQLRESAVAMSQLHGFTPNTDPEQPPY